MPLYLIGENIDKTRGFRQTEAGKLALGIRMYPLTNDVKAG